MRPWCSPRPASTSRNGPPRTRTTTVVGWCTCQPHARGRQVSPSHWRYSERPDCGTEARRAPPWQMTGPTDRLGIPGGGTAPRGADRRAHQGGREPGAGADGRETGRGADGRRARGAPAGRACRRALQALDWENLTYRLTVAKHILPALGGKLALAVEHGHGVAPQPSTHAVHGELGGGHAVAELQRGRGPGPRAGGQQPVPLGVKFRERARERFLTDEEFRRLDRVLDRRRPARGSRSTRWRRCTSAADRLPAALAREPGSPTSCTTWIFSA